MAASEVTDGFCKVLESEQPREQKNDSRVLIGRFRSCEHVHQLGRQDDVEFAFAIELGLDDQIIDVLLNALRSKRIESLLNR